MSQSQSCNEVNRCTNSGNTVTIVALSMSALGLEERHWNTNFNRSGETDRVERCDGGIPTCQGFHREAVKRLSLMEFMVNCIGGAQDVERVVQLSCGEETTGICEQHQDFLPSQPGESLMFKLS